MQEFFRQFARATSEAIGSPLAFLSAVSATIVWATLGPAYHYSDTWQLVINTGTSVATFLIVFLIQYTQNRDTRVTQLKLDELIRAVSAARTELVSMENLTDDQLESLKKNFEKLQQRAAKGIEESPRQEEAAAKL